MQRLFLSFLVFFLAGCSNSGLPSYYKLDRLRILALQVDKPEIQNAVGAQSVVLTPYLSDIGGQGSVSLTIMVCLDPGVSVGAVPSCDGVSGAVSLGTSVVNFSSTDRTEATSPLTVNFEVPAALLTSYAPYLQFNGISYLITAVATRGADSVKSFRRVLVSTKTANQNPTLLDLRANETSLSTLPSSSVKLDFTVGESPENYQSMSVSGIISNLTERYEVTWFFSDGDLDSYRSFVGEKVKWSPPAVSPVGRSTVVVGVLRDGRGGSHVLVKKF